MIENKGRFIPNIHDLSYYGKADTRSPFEGELCVNADTTDVYYWYKDENNIWHSVSRTKEIQDVLDNYKKQAVFDGAKSIYQDGQICRLFYDLINRKVWLNDGFDYSRFSYYIVKAPYYILGEKRYVTGKIDQMDKILTPIGEIAESVHEIYSGLWYIVEFYDENKNLKLTRPYLSTPIKQISFDNTLADTSLVSVSMTFNQTDKDGNPILYKGQDISVLKPKLVLKYLNGIKTEIEELHKYEEINLSVFSPSKTLLENLKENDKSYQYIEESNGNRPWVISEYLNSDYTKVTETQPAEVGKYIRHLIPKDIYDKRFYIENIDKVDTSKVGNSFNCVANYVYIKPEEGNLLHRTENFNIQFYGQNSVSFTVGKYSKRVKTIKSVKVRLVGKDESTVIPLESQEPNKAATLVVNSDNSVTVTIPTSYYETGRNIISISYEETNTSPAVKIPSFTVAVPFTVKIVDEPYHDIVRTVIATRLSSEASNYTLEFFVYAILDNFEIRNITNDVEWVVPYNNALHGTDQNVTYRIYVDSLKTVYKTYTTRISIVDPRILGNSSNPKTKIAGRFPYTMVYTNNANVDGSVIDVFKVVPAITGSDGTSTTPISFNDLLNLPEFTLNGIKAEAIDIYDLKTTGYGNAYISTAESINDLCYRKKLIAEHKVSPSSVMKWHKVFDLVEHYNVQDYTREDEGKTSGESSTLIKSYETIIETDAYGNEIKRKVEHWSSVQLGDDIPQSQVGRFVTFKEFYKRDALSASLTPNKPLIVVGKAYDKTQNRYICTGAAFFYAYPSANNIN